MSELTIQLTPDLETRLAEEAARQGREPAACALDLLESCLRVPEAGPDAPEEARVRELFRGIRRKTPEDLRRLADEQGVKPFVWDEWEGNGCWPEDEDVDEFLEARRGWQREGRRPLAGLDEEGS